MMRADTAGKEELEPAKDRRHVYGEAPHGARENIPLRKKLRNAQIAIIRNRGCRLHRHRSMRSKRMK
jgi:hypothetical protein